MWCDILKAVPRSRLVLKNKPFLCPETQQLWLKRFTARGVAGWRVDLLPLTAATGAHLGQYAMMDIALDPWPYAGASPRRRHPPTRAAAQLSTRPLAGGPRPCKTRLCKTGGAGPPGWPCGCCGDSRLSMHGRMRLRDGYRCAVKVDGGRVWPRRGGHALPESHA